MKQETMRILSPEPILETRIISKIPEAEGKITSLGITPDSFQVPQDSIDSFNLLLCLITYYYISIIKLIILDIVLKSSTFNIRIILVIDLTNRKDNSYNSKQRYEERYQHRHNLKLFVLPYL